MSPTTPFLESAPASLAGWVALFEHGQLPVMASTAATLDELRDHEDAVDARMLAEIVAADPLMTIRVLALVAQLRRGREGSETETATAALVMLGIPPFFRHFSSLTTVESLLEPMPEALEGFQRVLRRARRAARFAVSFAAHRADPDAAVIHEAALLHDFAELLLWLRAPQLALAIEARKAADSTLRSAAVQRELLNIDLDELEHALMLKWRLPSLLVDITHEHAGHLGVQVRNVRIAIRVARHSAAGWDNAAIPDDTRDVAALLNISAEAAARLLREIDLEDQPTPA